jgi:hypothetical protein
MAKKTPYNERSDLEKIKAQWTKLSGLHDRAQWSAAVIRAATAAELAANFAIRIEFKARSEFNSVFVDKLLKWANGLNGKLDKLLMPLLLNQKNYEQVKRVVGHASHVNALRNRIVHSGEFCNPTLAKDSIRKSQEFINAIVLYYEKDFELPPITNDADS